MDNFDGLSISDLPPPLSQAVSILPPGLGKRERTRRQLLLSAIRVFGARGVREATIHEIAQQAEMTAATVYNHFESKEAIIEAVGRWFTGTLCESIQASQRHVPRGAQRMAIGQRRYAWLARESPRWASVLLDVSMQSPAMLAHIARYALADLRLGIEQKDFRVPSETSAMTMVMGVGWSSMRDIVSGRVALDHDIAVTTLLLRGLGMPFERAAECAARPLPPLEIAFAPALFEAQPRGEAEEPDPMLHRPASLAPPAAASASAPTEKPSGTRRSIRPLTRSGASAPAPVVTAPAKPAPKKQSRGRSRR